MATSRLVALEAYGIVEDYKQVEDLHVCVVGLGGVGGVVTEMLVRCSIRRLDLWDMDKVSMENMNRMFYTPSQCGMLKVHAAKETLTLLNPDIQILAHDKDVTKVECFDELKSSTSTCNLLICCVDNYQARIAVNRACILTNTIWIESGVSENAVSGHMQFILPGRTACFECIPPTIVEDNLDDTQVIDKQGVCSASLPTTMTIIASLIVQNTLKWYLKFGKVSYYIAYNALYDFFPQWPMMPNSDCKHCSHLQGSYPNWKVPSPNVDSQYSRIISSSEETFDIDLIEASHKVESPYATMSNDSVKSLEEYQKELDGLYDNV